MISIADQLPPEIARLIHPEWRRNEAAYWKVREQLLTQYDGQWIGFSDDKVIASGRSPVDVLHQARAAADHPFVICVGHETEPCRIRRVAFSYDSQYRGEALPIINVEFRQDAATPGVKLNHVIPDTGADATVLPWDDCQRLQLDPSQGTPGYLSGVAGSSSATVSYEIWAWLDGKAWACRVQADFVGDERILGRDVLNQLNIQFRGPAQEVVIES